MKKLLIGSLGSMLLLSACSTDQAEEKSASTGNKESIVTNTSSNLEEETIPAEQPKKESQESSYVENTQKVDEDSSENGRDPATLRKGDLDLNNINIIGLDEKLKSDIISYLEAIKDNKEEERKKYVADPDPKTDVFLYNAPYILSVTQLELDPTRKSAVTSEYNLNKDYEDVAIVKISSKNLDANLKEREGTGDYIFVKEDSTWKMYKFQ